MKRKVLKVVIILAILAFFTLGIYFGFLHVERKFFEKQSLGVDEEVIEKEPEYPKYSFIPSEYYDENKLQTFLPFFYLHNEREEEVYRFIENTQNSFDFRNKSNEVFVHAVGASVFTLGFGKIVDFLVSFWNMVLLENKPLFLLNFSWWRYGESECGNFFCLFEPVSNHSKLPDYFYKKELYENKHPEATELNSRWGEEAFYYHGGKYFERDKKRFYNKYNIPIIWIPLDRQQDSDNFLLKEEFRYDDMFSHPIYNIHWVTSQYLKYIFRPNHILLDQYMRWIEDFGLSELFNSTNGQGYAALHIRVGPIKNVGKYSDQSWKIEAEEYVNVLEQAMTCTGQMDKIKYLYVATDHRPMIERVKNSPFIKKMGIKVLSASWDHRNGKILENNMLQIKEIEKRIQKVQKKGRDYYTVWGSRNNHTDFILRECGMDVMLDIYLLAQSKILVGIKRSSFTFLACVMKGGDELCFDTLKREEFWYKLSKNKYNPDNFTIAKQDWSKWGLCDRVGNLINETIVY